MNIPERIFANLDALSRKRALTLEESLTLETCMRSIEADGKRHPVKRTRA